MSNLYLVWIDMEMSGLDPERDRILEMASLITDGDLNVICEGPELVVHQSAEVLAGMDAWNTKHHGESGLVAKVQASALDEKTAEQQMLSWIKAYCPKRLVPLAGNSVHQDRRFLVKYMPEFEAYLHYRNVDVSTVKELGKRWYPKIVAAMGQKKQKHRALDDIREWVEELKYYRTHFFKAKEE